MYGLKQVREKCAALFTEMDTVMQGAKKAGRDLTDFEVKTFENLETEYEAACLERDKLERSPFARAVSSRHEARAISMQQVKPSVTRGQGVSRPHEESGFESLGEFMFTAYKKPHDPRLNFQEFSTAAMGDGPSGGFAVPTQFFGGLLFVGPEDSAIMSKARVLPVGTPPDAAAALVALDQSGDPPWNQFGGVEVRWSGEGELKHQTDAVIRQVVLEPRELAAFIGVTEKLLLNWQSSGEVLADLLRGAVGAEMDRQFLLGSGVNRPLGYLHAGAAYEVDRAAANRISLTDILTMRAKILRRRGHRPTWMASTDILPELMSLRNISDDSPPQGSGELVFVASMQEGEPDRLLGLPIEWTSELPTLGSRGDLALVNWATYIVKPGSGPYVSVGTSGDDFERAKVKIRIIQYVDGRPWLTGPLTMPNGTTQSGAVVLDVP